MKALIRVFIIGLFITAFVALSGCVPWWGHNSCAYEYGQATTVVEIPHNSNYGAY